MSARGPCPGRRRARSCPVSAIATAQVVTTAPTSSSVARVDRLARRSRPSGQPCGGKPVGDDDPADAAPGEDRAAVARPRRRTPVHGGAVVGDPLDEQVEVAARRRPAGSRAATGTGRRVGRRVRVRMRARISSRARHRSTHQSRKVCFGGTGRSRDAVHADSGGGSAARPPHEPAEPQQPQRARPADAACASSRRRRAIAARSGVRPFSSATRARRCTSIVGMSMATGHASKQAPHSDDANGSVALPVVHAGQLRREHRADRARDRPSRTRGRRCARRPGRRSGRPSSGCSAAPLRPRGSASVAVRPLSSSTRWKSWPSVSAGPHRGVRVHPLAGGRAGQQLQEHLEVAPGRHELLDAHHGDQRARQGQAHPAVALGLDDARACRSRRRRSSRR